MNDESVIIGRTAAISAVLGITSTDVVSLHKLKLVEAFAKLGNDTKPDTLSGISEAVARLDAFINI